MSLDAFDNFPSKAWYLKHAEPSQFRLLAMALVGTFFQNLLLFFSPMRVHITTRMFDSGMLKTSRNPLRWRQPIAFSYAYALEEAKNTTVEERYMRARADLHRFLLTNAEDILLELRHISPTIPARVYILFDNEFKVYEEGCDDFYNPELAAELCECAANASVREKDWFRVVLEGESVFLESIPGTTASFEEKPPWIRDGEKFEPARRLEPHEVPFDLL